MNEGRTRGVGEGKELVRSWGGREWERWRKRKREGWEEEKTASCRVSERDC